MNKEQLREELLKNVFDIRSALSKFIEQNNRLTEPLKTDFDFMRWLDEGRMIVVGGGTGLGKSALVLQMLYDLAKNNEKKVHCIYATSEMGVEELTMRLIVNQRIFENVDMSNVRKLFNEKITRGVEEYAKKVETALHGYPFYLLNAGRFKLGTITEMIKMIRDRHPERRIFVAVDYLQLLTAGAEAKELETAIKDMKDTLVEERANAIVISALNRDATRNDVIDVEAFKNSSVIEYTADIAILLTFKNEKDKMTLKIPKGYREARKTHIWLHAVKNRLGSFFSNPFEFDKLRQRFTPVEIIEADKSNKVGINPNYKGRDDEW